jgi:hypothetical protein
MMMLQLLSAIALTCLGAYLFSLGLSNLAFYSFSLALSNSAGTSSSQLQIQLQAIQSQFIEEIVAGVVCLAFGTVVMQSSFLKIRTVIQPSVKNSISQPELPRVSKLSTEELLAELRARTAQDERRPRTKEESEPLHAYQKQSRPRADDQTKDESDVLHAYEKQLRARADEQAQFLVETGITTKQKRSSESQIPPEPPASARN